MRSKVYYGEKYLIQGCVRAKSSGAYWENWFYTIQNMAVHQESTKEISAKIL
jgi:hypothetical protein